uniref:Uncharacterized protein n=1 Tax=Macaca fascicularis TaxID=9541 RepID=Q8HXH4_MACFA|nr:hypothetical protein [Macaca fascicularis]
MIVQVHIHIFGSSTILTSIIATFFGPKLKTTHLYFILSNLTASVCWCFGIFPAHRQYFTLLFINKPVSF